MKSFNGATIYALRVGSSVMAPVIEAQQSTSQVVGHGDGSFTVTCLEGSVGLIPLEGATGRVLRSGESVNILPSGELGIAKAAGAAPVATPKQTPPPEAKPNPTEQPSTTQPPPEAPVPPVQHNDKTKEYILIGVIAGGAVGIAAGVAGAGHGHSSVSPSTP